MSGEGMNKANEKSAKKTSQLDDSKQKTAFIAEVEGDDLKKLVEEFEKMSIQEVRQECQQTAFFGFKSSVPKESPPVDGEDEEWSPRMPLNPSHAEENDENCKEETDSLSFTMNKNKTAQSTQEGKPSKTEKDGPKEKRS